MNSVSTSNTDCFQDCDYCLTNGDFADGTYRIIHSGKYCLNEDIIFNPREPEDISSPNGNIYNWCPGQYYSDLAAYPGTLENIARGNPVNGPFAGGFFAAISIETVDVEIDLNGHKIAQHPHFYTQQRFYSNIEVQNKPYDELSKRTTGIWMWGPNAIVNNIYIHNGELGLSSHHGIHSNGATNVVIEDMIIHDFEVGGIQFNDFQNITLRNIEIGPSATNVKLNGYYGNARYDLITLLFLNKTKPENDYIEFSDGRSKSLTEIENHLIATMDIAFRYANNILLEEDYLSPWYDVAMDLFSNENNGNIPDGSTLYGILFNSFLDAVQGFGQENQYGFNQDVDIKGVIIDNVYIHDLKKSVNEVPAMYMNKCYDDGILSERQDDIDVVRTPLGAVMDIRIMMNDGHNLIDNGLVLDKSKYAQYLKYKGNVLSDAQIGIKLYDIFKSRINTIMEDWATLVTNDSIDHLPECMEFVCNSDVIYQTNKGIIGLRIDEIDNVEINNLQITNLENLSPLGSYGCGNYSGPQNGGNPYQIDGVGNMNGDIRGISIYQSHIQFNGEIIINDLKSKYGDVYGIHIMKNSVVLFGNDDDENNHNSLVMTINGLYPQNGLTDNELDNLLTLNRSSFPNSFNGECNILIDVIQGRDDFITLDPSIPTGIDSIQCGTNQNLPGIHLSNHDGISLDYINLIYIIISVIFVIAITGFVFCVICNYRDYIKNARHRTNIIEEFERTNLLMDYGDYGAIPRIN